MTTPYRETKFKEPEPKPNLIRRIWDKLPSTQKRIDKLLQMLPLGMVSSFIGLLWGFMFHPNLNAFYNSKSPMLYFVNAGGFLFGFAIFGLLVEAFFMLLFNFLGIGKIIFPKDD